jgi:hypothetical protein
MPQSFRVQILIFEQHVLMSLLVILLSICVGLLWLHLYFSELALVIYGLNFLHALRESDLRRSRNTGQRVILKYAWCTRKAKIHPSALVVSVAFPLLLTDYTLSVPRIAAICEALSCEFSIFPHCFPLSPFSPRFLFAADFFPSSLRGSVLSLCFRVDLLLFTYLRFSRSLTFD